MNPSVERRLQVMRELQRTRGVRYLAKRRRSKGNPRGRTSSELCDCCECPDCRSRAAKARYRLRCDRGKFYWDDPELEIPEPSLFDEELAAVMKYVFFRIGVRTYRREM